MNGLGGIKQMPIAVPHQSRDITHIQIRISANGKGEERRMAIRAEDRSKLGVETMGHLSIDRLQEFLHGIDEFPI